jgi:myo-inositol 2-dehydrogenase/D-chiro-inositol 1-dehydrogenase/scyllo-inositol 2-dehydrogenase (NAD+)
MENIVKTDKIRILVIGTGRAGMIHARNFATSVPNARLTGICDPGKDALATASRELEMHNTYTDWVDAIKNNEADAIIVATPTDFHRDIVVTAANAGKHILCEKPMAMNGQECDEMIAAASKNDVKLQIGFMRRYDRNFMEAKERIEQGEIGDVVLVKSLTHGPSIPKPWQYDIARSNGPLAEVNSHDIDTLRWFTESEFDTIYAIGGNFRCPDAKKDFPDFYDNVVLTASFVNKKQGLIGGAVSVRYGYDARVEILGTNGILFIGSLENTNVVGCSQQGGMVKTIVPSWRNLFTEAYLTEDKDFIACILEDRSPKASGVDGKKAVEVVNAGNKSIIEKRLIKMEEISK